MRALRDGDGAVVRVTLTIYISLMNRADARPGPLRGRQGQESLTLGFKVDCGSPLHDYHGPSMTVAFLIALRDGLEAALIVGIICAYLVKLGRRDALPKVHPRGGARGGLSLVIGVVIVETIGRLDHRLQATLEGLAAVAAVVIMTWMLFWMRRQGAPSRATWSPRCRRRSRRAARRAHRAGRSSRSSARASR